MTSKDTVPDNISERILFLDIEITVKDAEDTDVSDHGESSPGEYHPRESHYNAIRENIHSEKEHHHAHSHNHHDHSHTHPNLSLDIPPLFPPLGISMIKRYINDKTDYYARTFDAGIKITKDIEQIYSGNGKIILTAEQVESMIILESIEFNELLLKSKRISIDSITDDIDFDKMKLIYNLKRLQELISEANVSGYGVIGFTVTTETSLAYSLLASKIIKEEFPEKKIMLGGVFFNDLTATVIEYDFIDFVVIGKGFVSTLKILNIINCKEDSLDSDGKIIYTTAGVVKIIDASEKVSCKEYLELLPDYDDFSFEEYKVFGREPMLIFMFSLGCKYNCSYCSWNSSHNKVESADVDIAADNIIELSRRYGVKEFYITNSSINQDRKSLIRFCTRLKESNSGIRYKALGNAEFIDVETATLLKESGCEVLFLGIESFDDSVLKKAHKFHSKDVAIESLKVCKECGLFTIVCLISGLPGESDKEHNATKEVLSDLDTADDYAIFGFQVYFGSDIFKNPERYDIQEIITTRKVFNIPLKFGYTKDGETWNSISARDMKRAKELKSVAYKTH